MFLHSYLTAIFSFLSAFIIVWIFIPSIVILSKAKKLFDEPDTRKSHNKNIPTLGGIAIFAALLISVGIFSDFSLNREFQYLTISSIILFFVGIKDDILIIAPQKKLLGQLLASLIIIVIGNLRFTSLHGFLGLYHLSYFPSALLTLFVFVVIINGFNLIDGIDGLAAGVGILASFVFGIWFLLNGEIEYVIISSALIGSLIAFFWFNVFSKNHKIFMGDTGSLLIGLFMALLAVRFNEMNIDKNNIWHIHAAPAVSFGILIIPLFDTLRVFLIRIIRGQSPFVADTNHVHHRLLAMGLTHLKATLVILGINTIIIFCAFYLNHLGIIRLMIIILILATLFSWLPELIFNIKEKRMPAEKF